MNLENFKKDFKHIKDDFVISSGGLENNRSRANKNKSLAFANIARELYPGQKIEPNQGESKWYLPKVYLSDNDKKIYDTQERNHHFLAKYGIKNSDTVRKIYARGFAFPSRSKLYESGDLLSDSKWFSENIDLIKKKSSDAYLSFQKKNPGFLSETFKEDLLASAEQRIFEDSSQTLRNCWDSDVDFVYYTALNGMKNFANKNFPKNENGSVVSFNDDISLDYTRVTGDDGPVLHEIIDDRFAIQAIESMVNQRENESRYLDLQERVGAIQLQVENLYGEKVWDKVWAWAESNSRIMPKSMYLMIHDTLSPEDLNNAFMENEQEFLEITTRTIRYEDMSNDEKRIKYLDLAKRLYPENSIEPSDGMHLSPKVLFNESDVNLKEIVNKYGLSKGAAHRALERGWFLPFVQMNSISAQFKNAGLLKGGELLNQGTESQQYENGMKRLHKHLEGFFSRLIVDHTITGARLTEVNTDEGYMKYLVRFADKDFEFHLYTSYFMHAVSEVHSSKAVIYTNSSDESTALVESMTGILDRIMQSYEKGASAEMFASSACQILESQGIINSFRKSEEYEDTFQGVDIWIMYNNNELPIQIKSSEKYQKSHIKKYPKVPSIIINSGETRRSVAKKIILAMAGAAKGKVLHL